jgi:hypothetical protein
MHSLYFVVTWTGRNLPCIIIIILIIIIIIIIIIIEYLQLMFWGMFKLRPMLRK